MSSNNEEQHADEADADLHEDYYMVLNLSRDATDKELTQAYHRFSLIYHPDKHQNADSKVNAELIFAKIKTAYEVLSDPHKRAVYDSVGVKGLKKNVWQLINRTKTPQEIREEYERLEKENKAKLFRLNELANSQGIVKMDIDATNLFNRDSNTNSDFLSVQFKSENLFDVSIKKLSLSQSVNIPLTEKQTGSVYFAANDDRFKSQGLSQFSLSIKQIISQKTWVEVSTLFGENKSLTIKGFRSLSKRCTGSLTGMFAFTGNGIGSGFAPSLTYSLTKNLVGNIEYQMGLNAHMKTTIEYEHRAFKLSMMCQLSVQNPFVGCRLSKSFKNDEIILHTKVRYGYMGVIFEYGLLKKITEFSFLHASIMVSQMTGVLLNIRVDRGSQSFIFPIHLSHEIAPSAIFYGTVMPIAIYYIVKKLIVEPYLNDKAKKDALEKQKNLKSELSEKKRQSLAAQELMKEAYSRSIERETPNGLLILKAVYGSLPQQLQNIESASDKMINVTVPLQVLVKDHSLQILSDSTKSDLQGFFDPCIGEPKSLYINYKFNNQHYEAVFQDNEIVRIPRKAHIMQK